MLTLIHGRDNHKSLVYWVGIKNDDEFPTQSFGSILEGSAYKLGLFRRKGTEHWVTGSGIKEKVLSISEAIASARKHRDPLVARSWILEEFSHRFSA